MIRYLATAALLLLTACDPARDYPMERKAKIEISSIVWIDAKPTECGHAQGNILGCTKCIEGNALCTITMPADSPDWVVAHEFKHAFGWQHGVLK